jgi:GH25 family lysozyme M1 (1,4-beta-N-acetylmuramidase)
MRRAHRLRSGALSALLLVAPACGEATDTARREVAACAPGAVTEGIDVSVYQGTFDWKTVKASGVEFAIIRTSDGLNFPDSRFADNWAGAKAAGVIRGVYQYFEPAQDPIAQADMMLAAMGPLAPGDLPPTIDVETTGGKTPSQLAARVAQWSDHVAAATGRAPIIYVGKYFWQDQVGGVDMTRNPLWEAQWGSACPDTPSPWKAWTFWQYTATGKVDGITGDMDLDRFNGDRAALVAFANQSAACGVIDAAGGVVDDGDPCFVPGGSPMYLRAVTGTGWEGDLTWTHATSSASEANFATWQLYLAQAGRYRVEVYTPTAYAQSRQARYVVAHAGATDTVTIDQAAVDGWQSLGELDFAAGGMQSVHLGDNTGEPVSASVQLVFDAVRLTRIDPDGGGGPGTTGGGDAGIGGDDGGSPRGGCAAGGGGGRTAWIGLGAAIALAATRRRRR